MRSRRSLPASGFSSISESAGSIRLRQVEHQRTCVIAVLACGLIANAQCGIEVIAIVMKYDPSQGASLRGQRSILPKSREAPPDGTGPACQGNLLFSQPFSAITSKAR